MIKTENLGDDVIGIILDRPNSSHNFQDEKAISEFYNLLKEIEKKNNVKGVVIYSAKKSLEILKSISNYADICELGFPHNTPIADGGQIQTSAYRAIKNGIKIPICFNVNINGYLR